MQSLDVKGLGDDIPEFRDLKKEGESLFDLTHEIGEICSESKTEKENEDPKDEEKELFLIESEAKLEIKKTIPHNEIIGNSSATKVRNFPCDKCIY